MSSGPTTAMVLATGLGQRMRPLTDRLPKPLVQVRDEAMLDTILDRLQDHCIGKVVVNLHYLGEMIEAHLEYRERPQIVFSPERAHMATGGGVTKAPPQLGPDPFSGLNRAVCWPNVRRKAPL